MDDHEINKRLAEIAGVEVEEDAGLLWHQSEGPLPGIEWSPLTDWSQLGPLRVEQEISTMPPTRSHPAWRAYGKRIARDIPTSTSAMRAICLAIIAAHGEE